MARAFYYPMGITDKFGVGLEGSGTWSTERENFPNGCHICEVDAETGEVTIGQYTLVDDIGTVINPMIAEGQLHGAWPRAWPRRSSNSRYTRPVRASW